MKIDKYWKEFLIRKSFGEKFILDKKKSLLIGKKNPLGILQDYFGGISDDGSMINVPEKYKKDAGIYSELYKGLTGNRARIIINEEFLATGNLDYQPQPNQQPENNLEKEVKTAKIKSEPAEEKFIDPWKVEVPKYEKKKSKSKSPWHLDIPKIKDD